MASFYGPRYQAPIGPPWPVYSVQCAFYVCASSGHLRLVGHQLPVCSVTEAIDLGKSHPVKFVCPWPDAREIVISYASSAAVVPELLLWAL